MPKPAKWLYTGPRRITFKIGPEVWGSRTLSHAAGYVSPEGGAAPLASTPPSWSDRGDQLEVSMRPARSVADSLRTVGVPAPDHHTLTSVAQGC